MTPDSWHDAYYSALQNLWSLLVVPTAFLAFRLAAPTDLARACVPAAARFVSLATLAFALETMLDPIATGPLVKSEALAGTAAATLVPFLFVYLGDLRVLLVALAVARPGLPLGSLLGRAAAATAIVPIATGVLFGGLRLVASELHGQWLWMIYEAGFLALCVVAGRGLRSDALAVGATARLLGTPVVPAANRSFLAALFGFSAAYYALWLAADVLIVLAGQDVGWALRMVPNQLYYAFWTPFVYFRFFSAPAGGSAARLAPDAEASAPNARR